MDPSRRDDWEWKAGRTTVAIRRDPSNLILVAERRLIITLTVHSSDKIGYASPSTRRPPEASPADVMHALQSTKPSSESPTRNFPRVTVDDRRKCCPRQPGALSGLVKIARLKGYKASHTISTCRVRQRFCPQPDILLSTLAACVRSWSPQRAG